MTGQSATRVHPAVASFATQQWDVEVEDDACLVVLPGPTIPFRGSRYYQRGRVELAPRARLIWGDIWLPGRYDRGELSERFQFERIVQDFEVRRAGRLVYRDRFRWDGPWAPDEADWYFGGALASASLFVAGPVPEALPEAGPALRRSVFRLDSGEMLHPMVRPPGGRHGRPRPHRDAPGRELDRRARGPSLAPRLERPRPQPLVFDAGGRTGGWDVEARVRSTIERRIDVDRLPNGHPNSRRASGGDSSTGKTDVPRESGSVRS